jgi:hypothetical protein
LSDSKTIFILTGMVLYRLLLRVYPPGPRRAELQNTLLEAGRRRPSAYQAVNLIAYGMRARLGRPRSRGIVALAVLASLACGFVGAAIGNRLAWETTRDLPTGAELAAIRQTLHPGIAPLDSDHDSDLFANNGGETEYGKLAWSAGHTAATRDFRTYTDQATARLTAAGWRVLDSWQAGPGSTDGRSWPADSQTVVATRGGLILEFQDAFYADSHSTPGGLNVGIRRAETPLVLALTVAAGLLGLLVGWFVTGWASRRTGPRRVGPPVLAGLALVAIAFPWLIGVVEFVAALWLGYPSAAPFWRGLDRSDDFGGLVTPAAALATAALAVAALPGRRSAADPAPA